MMEAEMSFRTKKRQQVELEVEFPSEVRRFFQELNRRLDPSQEGLYWQQGQAVLFRKGGWVAKFCGLSMQTCLVAHLCSTVFDPLAYSLPDSSVHVIFQARTPEWVAISPPGDLPNPGSNSSLLCLQHCRRILYLRSHQGSPFGLRILYNCNQWLQPREHGVAQGSYN